MTDGELMRSNFYIPPDMIKRIKIQNRIYIATAIGVALIAIGWGYLAIREMTTLINNM